MKTATDLVLERFLSRYWDMSRPLRGNSTNVSTLVLATWDHLNTADINDINYNDDDSPPRELSVVGGGSDISKYRQLAAGP